MKKIYFYIAIFASAMFVACSSDAESLVTDLNDAVKNGDKSEVYDLCKDLSLLRAQYSIASSDYAYVLANAKQVKENPDKNDSPVLYDQESQTSNNEKIQKELGAIYADKISDYAELCKNYSELLIKAKGGEVDAMTEISEGIEDEYNTMKSIMDKIKGKVDETSKQKIESAEKMVTDAAAVSNNAH